MTGNTQAEKVRVCLVSGHALVLQELQRLLLGTSCVSTTLKISDGTQFSETCVPIAGVYVIDCEGLAGRAEAVIGAVLRSNASAHVLVLVDDLSENTTFPLLNLGVKGLLKHDVLENQLPRALDAVASGGYWVPRTLLASFVESVVTRSRRTEKPRPSPIKVSRREMDILDGLLANLSNKEIASKYNISERTVKFHVSNLLAKFNVRRRADLLLLWYQQGTEGGLRPRPAAASTRHLQ